MVINARRASFPLDNGDFHGQSDEEPNSKRCSTRTSAVRENQFASAFRLVEATTDSLPDSSTCPLPWGLSVAFGYDGFLIGVRNAWGNVCCAFDHAVSVR